MSHYEVPLELISVYFLRQIGLVGYAGRNSRVVFYPLCARTLLLVRKVSFWVTRVGRLTKDR